MFFVTLYDVGSEFESARLNYFPCAFHILFIRCRTYIFGRTPTSQWNMSNKYKWSQLSEALLWSISFYVLLWVIDSELKDYPHGYRNDQHTWTSFRPAKNY